MRLLYAFCLFCSFGSLLLAGGYGCSKEYSFEGTDTLPVQLPPVQRDSTTTDTVPSTGANSCTGCSSSLLDGRWSLKVGNILYCGAIDTAILSMARNTFTFFGPSECSADSGLIINAMLSPDALNRSVQQYVIAKATLYYYDKVSGLYMVQSQQGKPFTVTILRYDHDTKEAEGSFEGVTVTRAGQEISVKDGRWKTKLY